MNDQSLINNFFTATITNNKLFTMKCHFSIGDKCCLYYTRYLRPKKVYKCISIQNWDYLCIKYYACTVNP